MQLEVKQEGDHIWFTYKEKGFPNQGGWLFNQAKEDIVKTLENIISIIK